MNGYAIVMESNSARGRSRPLVVEDVEVDPAARPSVITTCTPCGVKP